MNLLKVLTVSVLMSLTLGAAVVHADEGDTQVNAPASIDFVLFSNVKVKADKVAEFKKLLLPYADLTRKEAGSVAYYAHQSPDDPTEFEMYEHWASNEARSTHLTYDYTIQFFAAVGPMFEAGYPVRKKFIELK